MTTLSVPRILVLGALALSLPACGHFYQRSYVLSPESLHAVKTIAVTPFENLSPYGEAGKILADLFSQELSKLQTVTVVDRSLVERRVKERNFKLGKTIDRSTAKDIGGMMGTDAVLIGSVTEYSYQTQPGVRQSEPAVGFSVRLVDARSGAVLWAASVSRSSYDVLTLERDPVNKVAQDAVAAEVDSAFK